MTVSDPARCIPILASLDIAATEAFYVGALGFSADRDGDDYLIVRRDEMEIHFWRTDDPAVPKATSCYIRGGQVGALHAEFSARAVAGLSDFTVRPWAMKEFHLIDPHGNLLRFGCIPDE